MVRGSSKFFVLFSCLCLFFLSASLFAGDAADADQLIITFPEVATFRRGSKLLECRLDSLPDSIRQACLDDPVYKHRRSALASLQGNEVHLDWYWLAIVRYVYAVQARKLAVAGATSSMDRLQLEFHRGFRSRYSRWTYEIPMPSFRTRKISTIELADLDLGLFPREVSLYEPGRQTTKAPVEDRFFERRDSLIEAFRGAVSSNACDSTLAVVVSDAVTTPNVFPIDLWTNALAGQEFQPELIRCSATATELSVLLRDYRNKNVQQLEHKLFLLGSERFLVGRQHPPALTEADFNSIYNAILQGWHAGFTELVEVEWVSRVWAELSSNGSPQQRLRKHADRLRDLATSVEGRLDVILHGGTWGTLFFANLLRADASIYDEFAQRLDKGDNMNK